MTIPKIGPSHILRGIAVLLVIVVFGEGYIRFFSAKPDMSPPALKAQNERSNLPYVPSLFSRHLLSPRQHSVYFTSKDSFRFQLPEGFENVVKWPINSHGYRGPEFAWNKPEGTIRIIIYGGSFVFDIRTAGDMDWPRQAEKILRQRGHHVEIINAGIPGHMSFDSLGRLFTEGHRLNPDFVVICNKWNDLKYFISKEPLSRQIQVSVPQPDPRYEYQGALDRWLGSVSQLYCRLRIWNYERKLPPEYVDHPNRDDFTNKATDEALRQYRLHFEMFADATRNIGAKPILMTQPLLISPENSKEARAVIEYEKVLMSHEQLCEAMDRADEAVRAVARTNDVALIDASTSRVAGKIEYFTDHVHLTRNGSLEFAQVVADELEKILP